LTIDQAQRRKAIARWHRRIALAVGIWLLLLAISGLVVNHANDWGLDRRPLPAGLQGLVYGLERETVNRCSALPEPGLDCSTVFATVSLPAGTLLVGPYALNLLDQEGRLLETLPSATLGLGRIEAVFADGGDLYFRDTAQVVHSDPDLVEWQELSADAAAGISTREGWQTAADAAIYISWERLLLDLHAGRFLGPFAKAFTDLMAGLILLLAVSGGWLYLVKRKRNGNGNGN